MASADEGFRVTDRRRRSDEDTDTSREPPRADGERGQGAQIEPEAPGPEVRSRHGEPSAPEGDLGSLEAGLERNLTGLFIMLASSAAMALGEAPDPVTGQVHCDLGQAAEMIDLLVLLREKTEGHRTPEETQVLDELVYDLQVRYVAAMRRSARPPGPARS